MNTISHDGVIYFNNWDASHIPEILHEIYLQRIYYPYFSGKKDLTIIDGGANIGLWSLYAQKYAKVIHAIEPTGATYSILERNIKQNKAKAVQCHKMALSGEDGQTDFYISSNSTMNSLIQAVNDTKEKETVKTITLETFLKDNKIDIVDFFKCDIEGAEAKLFTSEGFRNVVHRINCMVYEWHTWSDSNPNLLNYGLKELGFTEIHQLPCQATVFACVRGVK